MTKVNLFKNLIIIAVSSMVLNSCTQNSANNYPIAKKESQELSIHGNTRVDNYYWLNDRENPEVIKYLEDENAYTESILKPTEKFQEDLFEEMKSRIKETDESVPYKKNGYFYYTRYEEGKEYPIYCRKEGSLDSEEEIMLDVNEMAEGYDYYQVSGLSVSLDNKMLAYGVDTVSRRMYTIYIKNLETGEIYNDKMSITEGYAIWANDNKTLFYTKKDEETLRSNKIFKHILWDVSGTDVEIYSEDDETFDTGVWKSKSGDYILIGSYSTMSDEYRFIDANKPNSNFKIIQKRERGLEYSVSHFGGYFYIRTNLDAQNFRLMRTSVNNTSKENWEEVIPHRDKVFLEGTELFKDYLVVEEREDGLSKLRVINWKTEAEYYIDFDEEVYMAYISTNLEFDSELLRFGYTSMTTPNSTFDYNMVTREKELKKQQEIVGGYNAEEYETKRLWATADDGTKIPMSIVYKKGIELDGTNPTLLYAYGSYGATMDPYFSSVRLSLLDR
jgi:oligopeptidase B